MTNFESFLHVVGHYKYLITIVLGLLFVCVISDNSFINLMKLSMRKADLQKEIKQYREQSVQSSKELKTLKNNKNTIEKIARERYFMKKEDEDIFVLSTEMK